jgi:predicted small lipoprotein YifL
MTRRLWARLAAIGLLALVLVLSGCGNSKKGNSYLPPVHGAPLSSQTLPLA